MHKAVNISELQLDIRNIVLQQYDSLLNQLPQNLKNQPQLSLNKTLKCYIHYF